MHAPATRRARSGREGAPRPGRGLGLALAFAHGLALALSGCVPEGPEQASECVEPAPAALYGADAPDAAPRGAALGATLGAVFALYERGELACTASLIARGWALTAAHCAATEVDALRLASGAHGAASIPVVQVALHPSLDAALLAFDPSAIAPCVAPLTLGASDASIELGAELWLAGFGLQEDGRRGRLEVVAEIVAAIDDSHLWVDGAGTSGACVGDSGGPLLAIDETGSPRIAGILHEGSASCLGYDGYVRADRLVEWVTAATR